MMKIKLVIVFLALQLYISTALQLAYAEQKLVNITEDTLAQNSYRPIAGKEYLVAVKLTEEIEGQEQAVSNETVMFQTSAGTLSEAEVSSNIYGEAITWLTTSDIADTAHVITATVKNKPEILPVIIEVKNITLPLNAPTAEELALQVEENNAKMQDVKGDITITSNRPESSPLKQVKIWRKGNKQKVEEISPKPAVYIRPELIPDPNPPVIQKEIVTYNPQEEMYAIHSKEETQITRFPYTLDYVDKAKGIIVRGDSYIGEGNVIRKFITEDSNFAQLNDIWVFLEEKKHIYEGIGLLRYTDHFVYSNIEINTGLSDNLFQ